MFNWLVTQSLRNRVLVLIAALGLIVYGAFVTTRLPIDVFPDLNRPTVTLMTEAVGMAPEEVETLVTYPIETALNGMPGVQRVRSVSSLGLSIVYAEFGWGTDIYRARQLTQERLASLGGQLPDGVESHMGPISSIMGEILLIAMSSETASPMNVREAADFIVRPQLLAIPGVAQVIPIGGEVRQFQVSPRTTDMRRLGVSLTDIDTALEGFARNTGAGVVNEGGRQTVIRNLTRTTRLEDLAAAPVGVQDGATVSLAAVADVTFGARPRVGSAGYNGNPAVIVSVQKQPGADTTSVTRQIEATLKTLSATLPAGVEIKAIQFRQADFIRTSIETVEEVMTEALVIVGIVLFLFLLNVRTTAISLLAIPISVLVTAIIFQLLGQSINTMTLGGIAIAIGALVDDAVVGVENVFRRLRENRERGEPRSAFDVVLMASNEVRSGIIYATIVTALVTIPLFALPGLEGKFFSPLGLSYLVATLASLVVSVTVTPVLAHALLPRMKRLDETESPLLHVLKRWMKTGLQRALPRPRLIIGAALGLAAIGVIGAVLLPRAFLPAFNETTAVVNITFEPGTSLEESERVAAIAERLLLQVAEVKQVGRRTGRAELDEHAEGVHYSEIDVDLKKSKRSREQVFQAIRDTLGVLPGAVSVGQPIAHRVDHMLAGVTAPIAVKVAGDDLDAIRTTAGLLEQKMRGVPGLVDVRVERQVRVPQTHIRVDPARAQFYGVAPAQVAEALETLGAGRRVAEIVDGARRFDLVVRLNEAERSREQLASVLIDTPRGPVALSALADIIEADGPNQILRENGRRRIAVLANTDGSSMQASIAGIEAAIASLTLPEGATVTIEGAYQAQGSAAQAIALLSLLSLVLIFAVLYSRYRSALLVGLIMGSIPMALVGAVVALLIAGAPLSIASMVGFVTLAGITARNGILKISHWINLVLHEGETWGDHMVIRGSLDRLAPVLMTALSAGLALVPLLIGADEPGKEILHPVAVTIFGGLFSATLLDAFVTPTLFLRYGRPALERLVTQSRTETTAAGVGQRPAEVF